MSIRNRDRASWQGKIVISLLFTTLLGAACVLPPLPAPPFIGAVLPSATPQSPTIEPSTPTPEPPTATPEPPTATPEPPTPTLVPPTATAVEEPQSGGNILDQIFPPGSVTERELVLNNCGSCHSWVCPIIGQRAPEKWTSIRATHEDFVSGLNQEDLDLLFGFLAETFNDTNPVPDLPEGLRSQGCTTQS